MDKKLLKYFLFFLLASFIVSFYAVIKFPENALVVLDTISVKFLIFILIELVLLSLAFSIYKYFYIPNAKRLIMWGIHSFVFIGTIASVSPYALLPFQSLQYKDANIEMQIEAASDSSMSIVGLCMVGVVVLIFLFINVRKFEELNAASL